MRTTWAPVLDPADAETYDAFVAGSPSGHYRQTRPWAAVAPAGTFLSPRFVTVRDGRRLLGTALVLRPRLSGVALPWAVIDRGPVVSDPCLLGPCLAAIEKAARARGVLRLEVMPYWGDDAAELAERELARGGYRDVQQVGDAHARTVRIDLREGPPALLDGPSMGQVRWRTRQAERMGATARRGAADDWPRLRVMHSALMRRQGLPAQGDAWWTALQAFASRDERGALFVCEAGGRVVAACVAVRHVDHATYAWGASVPDDLPFTKAVPPLVAAIRWAASSGCRVFDLGGVPLDGDPDPKRAAIATLKYDFSRRRVRLVRRHLRWLVP